MSIKVAVRVRPFNQREMELETKLCVAMEENKTTLFNLDNKFRNKDFYFDYSFWSHDSFITKESGIIEGSDSKYASQQVVFDACGADLLKNAWEGYHCTLFAYGQTGSGKSYSVMGYQPNVGIVPIMCKEIFNKIEQNSQNSTIKYEVQLGMMEIYNERAQDLLQPIEKRQINGLKIRESASLGFFAQGQKKYPVRSFEQIEQRIEKGSKNRTVAATQMNATSSRAHTIITIELKQLVTLSSGKPQERLSIMNLVDLAGSEKTDKTGATGDRLKEASSINKSLSTLGLVISTLADREMGISERQVPYRESVLTKLLKNALGGNSKTIMICAISPAYDNYEESLSTLRYADQAKKIRNKAIINESPTDKLIRELKQENQRLLKMVEDFKIQLNGADIKNDPKSIAKLNELIDLQENVTFNELMIQEQQKTEDEKLEELEKQDQSAEENEDNNEIDQNQPYLSNLNEDPQLNHKVQYAIKHRMVIGRWNKNKKQYDQSIDCPPPDIILNGLGIRPQHCQFLIENEGSGEGKQIQNIFLAPCSEDYMIRDNLYLNGMRIEGQIQLCHNDRIIIGQNTTFLVKISGAKIRVGTPEDENLIDQEFAQEELNEQQVILKRQAEEDLQNSFKQIIESKIKAIEEKHQREIQKQYLQISEQEKELKKQEKEIESSENQNVEQNQSRIQQLKQSLAESMVLLNDKKTKDKINISTQKFIMNLKALKNKKKLEKALTQINPKINEMNLIAEEFQRKVRFMLQLKNPDGELVKVLVENEENNTEYTWNQEKATDRYYVMRDIYEEYQQTSVLPSFNESNDPFFDEPDPVLIGNAEVKLDSMCYNEIVTHKAIVYSEIERLLRGFITIEGHLKLEEELQSQYIIDPDILLGKRVQIVFQIFKLKFKENVSCVYLQYRLGEQRYQSEKFKLSNGILENLKFSKEHEIPEFDEYCLSQLLKFPVVFSVYGFVNQEKLVDELQKNSNQICQEQQIILSIDQGNSKQHDLKEQKQQEISPRKEQQGGGGGILATECNENEEFLPSHVQKDLLMQEELEKQEDQKQIENQKINMGQQEQYENNEKKLQGDQNSDQQCEKCDKINDVICNTGDYQIHLLQVKLYVSFSAFQLFLQTAAEWENIIQFYLYSRDMSCDYLVHYIDNDKEFHEIQEKITQFEESDGYCDQRLQDDFDRIKQHCQLGHFYNLTFKTAIAELVLAPLCYSGSLIFTYFQNKNNRKLQSINPEINTYKDNNYNNEGIKNQNQTTNQSNTVGGEQTESISSERNQPKDLLINNQNHGS